MKRRKMEERENNINEERWHAWGNIRIGFEGEGKKKRIEIHRNLKMKEKCEVKGNGWREKMRYSWERKKGDW